MSHDKKHQSTGNYKSKRDSHENPTKNDKEKKKKENSNWVDLGKNTNSHRNKDRKK